MKKILFLFLLLTSTAYADTLVIPTTYSVNGQVTSTNLNGNNQAIASIINGGLDNNNANTASGYRFFETRSTLPSVGSQGRVVFLTSDNTLNFDTGSTFVKSVAVPTTPVQGDIIYYDGASWNILTHGISGQYLQTQGAGANPAWGNAVNLTGTQTIAGAKTFSDTMTTAAINASGIITGNVVGNTAGIHTGAVALNSLTISGGLLGEEGCVTVSVSNGADAFCATGYYMRGQHRDSDGSAGNLYCCKP